MKNARKFLVALVIALVAVAFMGSTTTASCYPPDGWLCATAQ